MPGSTNHTLLAPFPPAVTKAEIENSAAVSDPSFITGNLLSLSKYLINIVKQTNVFGPVFHDPYKPCLKTLFDRLHAGIPSLTPLPAIAKSDERLRQTLGERVELHVLERPLEDFEDLYYAVLARMQDMLHTLNMRLTSGFNTSTDALFPGGPSIADWHASLTAYWDILNDAVCARALDDAVRQGRVTCIYEEVMAKLAANEIGHDTADAFLEELFHSKDKTEGMLWIADWNPVGVGVALEQKYRTLFKVLKEEDAKHAREKRRRSKMPAQELKIKKTRSKSPRKRASIERMLEGMQEGLAVLQDRAGEVGEHGRVVGGSHMDAQQVGKDMRVEVDRYGQGQHAGDHDSGGQIQPPRGYEWQAKTQRVSAYTQYLRGQASHDSRSTVFGTTYDSLDGGTLGNSPGADMADTDTDMMGFKAEQVLVVRIRSLVLQKAHVDLAFRSRWYDDWNFPLEAVPAFNDLNVPAWALAQVENLFSVNQICQTLKYKEIFTCSRLNFPIPASVSTGTGPQRSSKKLSQSLT
ncbi:hypothetical protein CC86DRAFT_459966 [Ophiobolus disseminans]|uniref:Uncharacterized protein n=1 Tax=Ophiobolus disseminans TaxID=1469910 RepID=A0A6A6ZGS3_9PLEO|nr:hypothetical protein CC86DRAFT_459966 [Ophiobolus disseminans]